LQWRGALIQCVRECVVDAAEIILVAFARERSCCSALKVFRIRALQTRFPLDDVRHNRNI
jgi:hypothetical protein